MPRRCLFLPGGGVVCGTFPKPKPCSWTGPDGTGPCPQIGDYLCDYRPRPRAKRCDRSLCQAHARCVGPDLHWCLDHEDPAQAAKAKPEPVRREPVHGELVRGKPVRVLACGCVGIEQQPDGRRPSEDRYEWLQYPDEIEW